MPDTGERRTLRELRLRRALTQKELAAAVEVSYQSVQLWEAGETTPRPGSMRKLAEVLGVTTDGLYDAIDATKAERHARKAAGRKADKGEQRGG